MQALALEKRVGRLLQSRRAKLAVAESCTGGLVGHRLTLVSGASDYFLGGIIAYANEVKVRELGVSERSLSRHGAVSRQVARQMAQGVRRRFQSDVGLAVTGIAGPGGGSVGKPVGLVFIGASLGGRCEVRRFVFAGNRAAIKDSSCKAALGMLAEILEAQRLGSEKRVKE